MEEYRTDDVESELGLDRDALIRMALLLGSDYTEGVPGIGIVNALEIVRAFPTDEGLGDFREWVNNPDAHVLAAAQGKAVAAGESALCLFNRGRGPADQAGPSVPASTGLF